MALDIALRDLGRTNDPVTIAAMLGALALVALYRLSLTIVLHGEYSRALLEVAEFLQAAQGPRITCGDADVHRAADDDRTRGPVRCMRILGSATPSTLLGRY